jgi:hypothetical protein
MRYAAFGRMRHPRWFQLGLILLALGFLLQLITLIPWAFGAMC